MQDFFHEHNEITTSQNNSTLVCFCKVFCLRNMLFPSGPALHHGLEPAWIWNLDMSIASLNQPFQKKRDVQKTCLFHCSTLLRHIGLQGESPCRSQRPDPILEKQACNQGHPKQWDQKSLMKLHWVDAVTCMEKLQKHAHQRFWTCGHHRLPFLRLLPQKLEAVQSQTFWILFNSGDS